MATSQSLFSNVKLIAKSLTKTKFPLEDFKPFTIKLNNISCSKSTLESFIKIFNDIDNIPTFAFIAGFKPLLQCVIQAPIPSSPLGLIHLICEIDAHEKHDWTLPYNLELSVDSYEKTEKGISYLLKTEFYQQGKKTITNYNVMLDKAKGYRPKTSETPSNNELTNLTQPFASWATGLKTTWSYAKLSGDFNPIHLSSFLAKKLGLKDVIVHGMYNVHECLKHISKNKGMDISSVKIEFNKPCFMPNQVFLRQYQDTCSYGLFSGNKKDRYLKVTIK